MSYSTREADIIAERAPITSLWAANFTTDPALADHRFEWIYQGNPAGPARCWLLQHEDSKMVVGAAAAFPRRFTIAGESVLGAIGGDYSVLAQHRLLMPAMRLQRVATAEAKQDGFAFLYGLPALHSAPVLKRSGYRVIGHVTELTKVLTTRNRLKRMTRSQAIGSILAVFGDIVLRAVRFLRRPAGASGVSCQQCTTFDERFDQLWHTVSTQRPILGERSAEYLRWRFGQSPHLQHRIWTLVEDGTGQLAGYIVYHLLDRTVVIDDLLCLDTDGTLNSLLQTFEGACWREGVDQISLSYFGEPAIAAAFIRNMYRQRELASEALVSIDDSSPLFETMTEPANWWLFTADVDF